MKNCLMKNKSDHPCPYVRTLKLSFNQFSTDYQTSIAAYESEPNPCPRDPKRKSLPCSPFFWCKTNNSISNVEVLENHTEIAKFYKNCHHMVSLQPMQSLKCPPLSSPFREIARMYAVISILNNKIHTLTLHVHNSRILIGLISSSLFTSSLPTSKKEEPTKGWHHIKFSGINTREMTRICNIIFKIASLPKPRPAVIITGLNEISPLPSNSLLTNFFVL